MKIGYTFATHPRPNIRPACRWSREGRRFMFRQNAPGWAQQQREGCILRFPVREPSAARRRFPECARRLILARSPAPPGECHPFPWYVLSSHFTLIFFKQPREVMRDFLLRRFLSLHSWRCLCVCTCSAYLTGQTRASLRNVRARTLSGSRSILRCLVYRYKRRASPDRRASVLEFSSQFLFADVEKKFME